MSISGDRQKHTDPGRLLHNTLEYCGLQPKGNLYGCWNSRGLSTFLIVK